MPGMRTPAERFFAKVNVSGPVPEHCPELGPCHLWTGSMAGRAKDRRGRFHLDGKLVVAHRAAWTFSRGGPPPELRVLHRCDNPGCVNPAHLFLGTQADNMLDRDRKGRTSRVSRNRGESNPHARLTNENVLAIRMLVSVNSQSAVARCFGTKQGTISRIASGRARATA